jgi:Big-like domain-containing protein
MKLRFFVICPSLSALVACGGTDSSTGSSRPAVATVSVTASTSSLLVGATATFSATALDKAGSVIAGRPIAWSTTDATIASITPAGVVTGLAPGQTIVRATIDGVSGSAPITVLSPAVTSVEITGGLGSALLPGETVRLTAVAKNDAGAVITGKSFTWSTSNGAVATVSSDGTVLAQSPGTASIGASTDGKSASVVVTVEASALTKIVVLPAPMLVAVGGSYTATAAGFDQRGKPIGVSQFTFQSSDPTIATVSSTGSVGGVRAGTASLTASAQSVTGTATITVVPPTSLAGSVIAATGAQVANLAFVLQTGLGSSIQTFPASVDATGSFHLDAPLPPTPTDLVTLVVDDNGRPRVHHPISKQVQAAVAASAAARPLLIPESETFTSPTYGTPTVAISLQSAFTRVCDDNTNANCNSFFPQVWLGGIVPLWAASDFPIQLAFNHSATTSPITDADSIALWAVIHDMEADLGRPLFKPVSFSSLTPPDANGFSPKAVLVWVDNTLTGFSGYSNWIWDGNQNMVAAKTRVRLNSYLANRSLMSHELLHALGFHHTCAWSTVMGGYGCTSASGITQTDAAAFNLGYQARAAIVASKPTTTFGDALRGEQSLEGSPIADLTPLSRAVAGFAPLDRRSIVIGGRVLTRDGAP